MTKAAPASKGAKAATSGAAAGPVRAKPTPALASPTPAPYSIASRLQGGAPLPPSFRTRMERSFGRTFADVRVHTDGAADHVTRGHRAEALTVGRHIAFGAGRFQPEQRA